ncbi:MAG: YggT family protein [Spirochaetales bacterium]|nr:YggT family protein [Spirochaetales bacterium]
MRVFFQFAQAAISVYMLLIFIRVLLTWFQGPSLGRPFEILASITDPYIAFFRRFRFLRMGSMDFSPIAAVMTLIILLNIISSIHYLGKISLGIVLGIIVTALWSSISWILSFFLILTVIRLVAHFFRLNTLGPLLHTVDMIIHPLLEYLQVKILKGRLISFQNGLLLTAGTLFLVTAAGNFLIRFAVAALYSLPF